MAGRPPRLQQQLLTGRDLQLQAMTEAQFQREVMARLEESGWLAMHVRRLQGRDGRWLTGTSSAGYPDVTAVHPGTGAMLALELKDGRGRPTPAQREWIEAFGRVRGCTAAVVSPRDYDYLLGIIRRHGAAV